MPLADALYRRRKKNRRRNMPNVKDARTTTATNIQVTFNQDISAGNYAAGWQMFADDKDAPITGAAISGADIVNFTMTNPISKGQSLSFRYSRPDGSYIGARGEIMQSSTGFVFNMV